MAGLTRGTSAGHLARATLEAIAYQTADILAAMQADAGIALKELRVDGGATRNDLLMQFQADILGVPVVRPKMLESTAQGAAFLAGLESVCGRTRPTGTVRAARLRAGDEAAQRAGRWPAGSGPGAR
jgi:glycerol kinase